jgi:arylsulfatase A
LLTGRYCWRTRLKRGVIIGYDESPLIQEGQMTLARLLKERGYETAGVGKWHIGMTWQTKNGYIVQDDQNKFASYSGVIKENEKNIDFEKPILSGPLEVGFDYFFGTQGCSTGDPPYCFIEDRNTVGIPDIVTPEEFTAHPGVAPGLMVSDWSEENVDITFTEKGIAFIERHLKSSPDKPFFLYLALSSPHIPFLPPEFAKRKSEEGPRGDLVTVVDWSVGRISEVLDQYDLSDNTLLIFTSDNGPRRGANGHQSAGKFRGYKANIWEGGHRVPFVARWPGKISPNTQTREVINLTDLLSTFDFLTQGNNQMVDPEDGFNVWPAF